MTTQTKTPSRDEILEFMRESQEEGATSKEVAEHFGVQDGKVRPKLYQYRTAGYLKGDSDGFTITQKGIDLLEHPTVEKEPLTTDLDLFKEIGRAYQVAEGKLQTIAEHVFAGDGHDPEWVWQALNMTGLGLHIVRPWAQIWLARVDRLKDAPPWLQRLLAPPSQAASGNGGARGAEEETRPRKFSVAGTLIIPDPEGDYHFKEALQIVALNMGLPGNPKGENIADVITSIVNAVGGAGKLSETEQLLIKNLIDRAEGKGTEIPSELELRLRAIEGKLTPPDGGGGPGQTLSQLQSLLNTFATVLGFENVQALSTRLHGDGGDKNNTYSIGTLTDKEGNPITVADWLKVEQAKHQWGREDEELDIKRQNTRMMRTALMGLPKAMRETAEEIRQMKRGVGKEAEAVEGISYGDCDNPECKAKVPIPPGATAVVCQNCGRTLDVV